MWQMTIAVLTSYSYRASTELPPVYAASFMEYVVCVYATRQCSLYAAKCTTVWLYCSRYKYNWISWLEMRQKASRHYIQGKCISNSWVTLKYIPDNKVHGANTGSTWVLPVPCGLHVGLMNLAIRKVHTKYVWGYVEVQPYIGQSCVDI